MNELIERIFTDFSVSGVSVPIAFLHYEGHGEPYIVYMNMDADNSLTGDDGLIGYVDYYDFDVYAKGNYYPIIEAMKKILIENGFVWQVSRSSSDMWDSDTGYYHKTLNFAIVREEE